METDLFNQPAPEFDGAVYNSTRDRERLTGQLHSIFMLMSDGNYRTVNEIHEQLGYPHASISAQLRNLKKPKFGGHGLEKKRVFEDSALWTFKIIAKH